VAILVSTFGCVNGLTLAGARVVYAMARDGVFFRGAAHVHPRHRTPATALLLHGLVAGVLTLTGTYSDLLTLTAFSSLLFNVLTVVGLFVLRRRRPDLARPYRVWGYPAVPLLFVAVALFFLVYMPVADPRNTGSASCSRPPACPPTCTGAGTGKSYYLLNLRSGVGLCFPQSGSRGAMSGGGGSKTDPPVPPGPGPDAADDLLTSEDLFASLVDSPLPPRQAGGPRERARSGCRSATR